MVQDIFGGTAAINLSKHCSANMPTLILAKSQTVLNFSNYTLTQLTGVISALTLCFTQAVVPLNLHGLFSRFLQNVATDTRFGGSRPRSRKPIRKQDPTTNTGEGAGRGGFTRDRETCQCLKKCIHEGASMKQAFTQFICIKQRDQRLLAQLKLQGNLGHQVSEVWTFSEEVSWVEENQSDIPKGRLRDEHISQFSTPHSVSLIRQRGLTDLVISHSLSSWDSPQGSNSLSDKQQEDTGVSGPTSIS